MQWFLRPHGLGEANDCYMEVACALGEEVARRCLNTARVDPKEVDHIFFVSTTGLAGPSIDARLIGLLGLNSHTRRTPIWGLGCAGGVAGLAHAADYVRAYPGKRGLLVCVELCSLTFPFEDRSKRNLIAVSLFADGTAAVLVEGDALSGNGPEVIATQSTLFPDSLDLMGWDIVDGGMRVVFGAGIPRVVTRHFRTLAQSFLDPHNLVLEAIDHHVYHPGGAKVLQDYEQASDLPRELLQHSWEVLREHGNMSSVTVLFVLERFLRQGIAPGAYALLSVFGPGFSSEMALLRG